MSDGRLIDSLLAEIDAALVTLQSARKVATDLQRANVASRRAAQRRGDRDEETQLVAPPNSTLRYSGVTVAEAAELLGIGEEQVRRLLRSGDLAGISFGGRVGWRLNRAYVESIAAAWSEQRRVQEEARRALARRAAGRPVRRPRR